MVPTKYFNFYFICLLLCAASLCYCDPWVRCKDGSLCPDVHTCCPRNNNSQYYCAPIANATCCNFFHACKPNEKCYDKDEDGNEESCLNKRRYCDDGTLCLENQTCYTYSPNDNTTKYYCAEFKNATYCPDSSTFGNCPYGTECTDLNNDGITDYCFKSPLEHGPLGALYVIGHQWIESKYDIEYMNYTCCPSNNTESGYDCRKVYKGNCCKDGGVCSYGTECTDLNNDGITDYCFKSPLEHGPLGVLYGISYRWIESKYDIEYINKTCCPSNETESGYDCRNYYKGNCCKNRGVCPYGTECNDLNNDGITDYCLKSPLEHGPLGALYGISDRWIESKYDVEYINTTCCPSNKTERGYFCYYKYKGNCCKNGGACPYGTECTDLNNDGITDYCLKELEYGLRGAIYYTYNDKNYTACPDKKSEDGYWHWPHYKLNCCNKDRFACYPHHYCYDHDGDGIETECRAKIEHHRCEDGLICKNTQICCRLFSNNSKYYCDGTTNGTCCNDGIACPSGKKCIDRNGDGLEESCEFVVVENTDIFKKFYEQLLTNFYATDVAIYLISSVVASVIIGFLLFLIWKYLNKFQERHPMSKFNLITYDEFTISEEKLGEGSFGIVYKGRLHPIQSLISSDVAIKVVKSGIKFGETFLNEAEMMAKLHNENLAQLIGISFVNGYKIFSRYRKFGSLNRFLKIQANSIQPVNLMRYILQITQAMEYLAKNKAVHRDLATRNVLMKTPETIEVADFGLAIFEQDGKMQKEMLCHPKWAAIELLEEKKKPVYSEATDVWAFGVTVWEILSFAHEPYSDIAYENKEDLRKKMLLKLRNGDPLAKPKTCPNLKLYELMLHCKRKFIYFFKILGWGDPPIKRPTFKKIKRIIKQFSKNPEKYINIGTSLESVEGQPLLEEGTTVMPTHTFSTVCSTSNVENENESNDSESEDDGKSDDMKNKIVGISSV